MLDYEKGDYMNGIIGITYYNHNFMRSNKTYYFGYDEENEKIIRKVCSFGVRESLSESFSKAEFEAFAEKVMDIIASEPWKREYEDPHVLDGNEWKVTLHYPQGKVKTYYGMNDEPDNFNDFVNLWDI